MPSSCNEREAKAMDARALTTAPVSSELLAKADRHGVLQMRAPGLEDAIESPGLPAERALEGDEGGDEPVAEKRQRSEAHGRRVNVVRALGHVDVVVGADEAILALAAAEEFFGPVGHDLVRVHVKRRPGAHLEDVDHELAGELSRRHFVAGLGDRGGLPRLEEPEAGVRLGRGLLDPGARLDEDAGGPKAADGEVLDGPLRFDAVIAARARICGPESLFRSASGRSVFWPSVITPFSINTSFTAGNPTAGARPDRPRLGHAALGMIN
jgi:hypothetical protein